MPKYFLVTRSPALSNGGCQALVLAIPVGVSEGEVLGLATTGVSFDVGIGEAAGVVDWFFCSK